MIGLNSYRILINGSDDETLWQSLSFGGIILISNNVSHTFTYSKHPRQQNSVERKEEIACTN